MIPVGWMEQIMFHRKDSLGCPGRMDRSQVMEAMFAKVCKLECLPSVKKSTPVEETWEKRLDEIDLGTV